MAQIGTQVQTVALGWLVYELTGSAAQLGGMSLARAIPIILLSLFGGTLADQMDRRRLLVMTQSLLAAFSAALAVTVMLDLATVALLYAFAVITAAASAFDTPARQALVPTLVPRERLANALTLVILFRNSASVIGPAVGGLMLAGLGASACFWLAAMSFFVVVGALLAMRPRPVEADDRRRGLAATLEGLRFVRQRGILWQLMVVDFLATLLVSTLGLLPVFAEDVLDVGPQGFGILYAAPSVGAIIGAAIYSMMPMVRRPGHIVVVSVVGYGAMLAAFGLTTSFALALLFLAAAGALDAVSSATRQITMQLATPDAFRGRVGALGSVFYAGGPRLGQFQSGITASLIGPQLAMAGGGLACIIMAVTAPLWGRDLWTYRGQELAADVPTPSSASSSRHVRATVESKPSRSSDI